MRRCRDALAGCSNHTGPRDLSSSEPCSRGHSIAAAPVLQAQLVAASAAQAAANPPLPQSLPLQLPPRGTLHPAGGTWPSHPLPPPLRRARPHSLLRGLGLLGPPSILPSTRALLPHSGPGFRARAVTPPLGARASPPPARARLAGSPLRPSTCVYLLYQTLAFLVREIFFCSWSRP